MKKALSLLLLLPACGSLSAAGLIDFKPNQVASLVLGQTGFATSATGTNATGMDTPRGVAVDPTTGKVFVADRNNHRVLRFASLAALASGAAAERVLGQPDLTTTTNHAVSSTSMLNPSGLAFDAAGRLYVADTGFNRVLRFNAPSAALTDGIAADGVLGQASFITSQAALTRPGLNSPSAVSVEPVGDADFLWVADASNNRVLGYADAETLAPGADATRVLGQANFTSGAAPNPPTDTSLNAPEGVAASTDGFLWVSDTGNHRVLAYNNPRGGNFTAFNVFGQATFVTNAAPVSATAANLFSPEGLALDESGATYSLWVVDRVQNRVLRFDDVNTSIPDGSSAAVVLGQPSFTASGSNTSQTGFEFPFAVAVDTSSPIVAGTPRSILVADADNHRVLRFDPQLPTPPTLTLRSKIPKTTPKKSLVVTGEAAAAAGIAQVLYKGKKGGFKSVKVGALVWVFTARLKVGKNIFTVIAIDTLGQQSAPKTIVVKRLEE